MSENPRPAARLQATTAKTLAAVLGLMLVWALGPLFVTDAWLSVVTYAGITAIGALGLNLLTGYTGQVSLGPAALVGAGAYAAAYFGDDLGLPLPAWLALCALTGGSIGALSGPFALRLRGLYLVVVTLGLVFVAGYVFLAWRGLTGGDAGRGIDTPLSLGFVDFGDLTLLGSSYTREQSFFWLVWGIVGLAAVVTWNIVRTRPGRALKAIRDRDIAAEILGIEVARYKIAIFVISSAFAAVAGGLYGAYQQYATPYEFSILLSVQYVAIIIVGGLGTVGGTILGALFVGGIPRLMAEYGESIPGVSSGGGDGVITVFALNQIVFGVLIVLFLVFEPRGLGAIFTRIKERLVAVAHGRALDPKGER